MTTGDTTKKRPRGWGPYNCYLCRKELNDNGLMFNDTLAYIRVFTGLPGQGQSLAGGYAACDRHAPQAIEQAMRPLLQASIHRHKYPKGWQVVCYRVELDDHAEPRLGERLFVCRERLFEEIPKNADLLVHGHDHERDGAAQ